MKNIRLRSTVNRDLKTVYQRFDEALFRFLLPPGAQLLEFGGSKTGDRVHLKLPLAGPWLSEITEDKQTDDLNYFIDEGRELPFPLKKWRHKHVLRRQGEKTVIEDNMSFATANFLLDILFYPVLYLAFLPRIWQYKRYFRAIA